MMLADDAAARGDFERRTAQGASVKPRLLYSAACGRVRLHNVTVRNAGIDWEAPGNVYWRHRVRYNTLSKSLRWQHR